MQLCPEEAGRVGFAEHGVGSIHGQPRIDGDQRAAGTEQVQCRDLSAKDPRLLVGFVPDR